MFSLGREPRFAGTDKKSAGERRQISVARTGAEDRFRGRSQIQKSGTGIRNSDWIQRQRSVCEAAVVTSGSFETEGSRWPFDVKGKPVEPVRSTLDIEWLTGSMGGV
jgi:hypothetical protein